MTSAADDAGEACIFCVASDDAGGDASLVLHRGTHAFIILNKFPYNNGHLMVAPTRHIAKLAEATPDELSEVMALTRVSEIVLTDAYHPHGMNVGMNLGRPAGAGIPGHFHMHLVPRWNGDTNFMSVVGETRVVPEAPEETIARLKPLFEIHTHG